MYLAYFSYDFKNQLDDLKSEADFFIKNYPVYWMEKVSEFNSKQINFEESLKKYSPPKIKYIKSQFSKTEYIKKINFIKNKIKNGEVYQVNLTNKFYGEFTEEPDFEEVFKKIISLNPVPYTKYLKINGLHILSASPELFFKIDKNRNIITKPIKGTAKNKKKLDSVKERAENLMITDLMRNDLSRICKTGTVKVEQLFEKEKYSFYNHLTSTISGKLKDGVTVFDVIENIFPPGSMTGAPKIAAMNLISELEETKRGIYSGVIGHFSGDGNGEAEFSVVIRTLISDGIKFEFQVGGGITHESDPAAEYEEILTKATPIFKALGINENEINKLA